MSQFFFSLAWQTFSSWRWLSSVDLQITYEINRARTAE